jgi:predicted AAA+ superfamily ATPase
MTLEGEPMAYYQRALEPIIRGFKKRMLFISGPRQSGKTTLARHLLAAEQKNYFN